MHCRLLALAVTGALIAAACSGSGDNGSASASDSAPAISGTAETTATTGPATESTSTSTSAAPPAVDTTAPPSSPTVVDSIDAIVTGGTEQITVTDTDTGRPIDVFDADTGELTASGVTDDNGALVVRSLDGGVDHLVGSSSAAVAVTTLARDDHPERAFYVEQRLPTDGLGYIETRDGTTLSAGVWLPGPADDGPFPTVVEYSGYSPSDPESSGFGDIFTALGYAYVGDNIRGTGCSGGSFRYFEYPQSLDGYDAIETVAAQPWVQNNRVGMVGVSYPGISQLFVAQTQPPSLAAITPFSVLADSAISTLYPGGILNTGFAVPWTEERIREAQPNGQEWAAARVAGGDDTCATNQLLRLQNPDLLAEIDEQAFWTDEVAGVIAPRLFVDQITVPTFVAGAWQDEQTGGHFATMLDDFTGTDHLYVNLVNGLHTESIGPAMLPRFVEFLDLYVADRTPSLDVARAVAPQLGESVFGTADVALPETDRFAGTSHDDALAAFEAEPSVRVLFEQGAADGFGPRTPLPRFVEEFAAWPPPVAEPTTWHLGADGSLVPAGGAVPAGEVAYLALPDAVPQAFYDGSSSGIWSVDVTYDWQEPGLGSFASFLTEPLADDTVVVGSGSVDLWITSNLGDTDLEVTISEVRSDGQEVYVQSGWLRASRRALDEQETTELRPVHTHREEHVSPLPDGEFELVRVELFPFAHPFRAGSRLRLMVDAPGGNRPVWEFDTISGGEQVTIAIDEAMPSRLVLAVVPDVDVPPQYPPCDALRGQPYRPYSGN